MVLLRRGHRMPASASSASDTSHGNSRRAHIHLSDKALDPDVASQRDRPTAATCRSGRDTSHEHGAFARTRRSCRYQNFEADQDRLSPPEARHSVASGNSESRSIHVPNDPDRNPLLNMSYAFSHHTTTRGATSVNYYRL